MSERSFSRSGSSGKSALSSLSASEIRDRVRKSLSIRYLVPDAVEEYIRQHGLYRS